MLELCRITKFDLFFSFLEMLWLHIGLGLTTSCDPLLQKAYSQMGCKVRKSSYCKCVKHENCLYMYILYKDTST